MPFEEFWQHASPLKAGTSLFLKSLGRLGVNSVENLYMYVMYDAVWAHNGVVLKLPREVSDLFPKWACILTRILMENTKRTGITLYKDPQ